MKVILLGIGAGFLNTIAGGGSLITIPFLIFMGLPPVVANGTNRIGIFIQNIVSIVNFKRKGYFDYKLGLLLSIPAIVGSLIGTNVAINLKGETFNRILSVVMIMVLILILTKEKNNREGEEVQIDKKKKILLGICFLGVGIYGGLIQAGVGFIITLALTYLTGHSLVKIISLKVFVVEMYMIASLIIFIFNGMVHIKLGLLLAIGNSIGAYIGSNVSVNKGDKWIKIILSIGVILMALKLSGIIEL